MAVTALGDAPGALAAQKLLMPLEGVEQGVGVHITATSQSANKEVGRQNFLALLQLAGELYPQVLQLMGVAGQNPMLAPVATQAASGLQELFKRLLEAYDIRNPEKILPLGGEPAQSMAPPPNPLAALLGGGAGGAPGAGWPAGPRGAGRCGLGPAAPVPPIPGLLGVT